MPNPVRPCPEGTAPATDSSQATLPSPGAPTKEATTTERDATSPGEGTAPRDPGTGPRPAGAGADHAGAPVSPRPISARRRRIAWRIAGAVLVGAGVLLAATSPAWAAGTATQSLRGLISNLTAWMVGILAGLATLFFTVGGLRYLVAGGDPGQVEKAKTALRSAAAGYALAALAPLIVSILTSLFGGG